MAEYYDVTVAIRPEMAVYRGDPEVRINQILSIKRGDPYNLSEITISSHTGTHVDAPFHFFQHASTIEKIPFEYLTGRVRVVEIRGANKITREMLEKINIDGINKILFKTDHSYLMDRYVRFRSNYTHLDVDACGYMVARGFELVGIDSFSIEEYESTVFMGHKVLLGAGIVVLEMVDLKGIKPGDYEIICLPLKISGGDGAPARVILKTID